MQAHHLVVTLPRTLSQSALVEEIKRLSSKWMKGLDPKCRQFYWQRGYGAFSLGRSQLHAVVKYVSEQEKHHRRVSFQDEFRRVLAKYGVPFDERYVWD